MESEVATAVKAPAIQARNELKESHPDFTVETPANATHEPALPPEQAHPIAQQFLTEFTDMKASAIRRSLSSMAEMRGGNPARFSLLNIIEERGVRGTDSLYDPLTGSLKIPQAEFDQRQSPLCDFFTEDRIFRTNGAVELRGGNFYTALARRIPYDERLSAIR